MALERTTQTQTVQQAATNSDGKAPWADLEVTIPSDRDHASLVALVECALVELTHEQVGAVVIVQQVWGRNARSTSPSTTSASSSRSGTSTAGLAGTRPPSREIVRDELITKVTRSAVSPPERTREAAASEPNTFTVKPVRELQTP